VGTYVPTEDAVWHLGAAMTLKEELLMLWIFCLVLITFAARHFMEGAVFMVEHVAAVSLAYMPALLCLLTGHLR
jgi:hypothetical protein